MTYSHIHRETATHAGDPDDEHISEITGEAPPCDLCTQGSPQSVATAPDGTAEKAGPVHVCATHAVALTSGGWDGEQHRVVDHGQ